MTRRAVIVSTARTPIGRANKGAFNATYAQTLAAHAITAALRRSGVEPGSVDDVVLGCAMQTGSSGGNIARQSALRAALPVTVPGMVIDRACGSGLMAIATAAKQIVVDGMQVTIAGGVESVSLVREDYQKASHRFDPWLRQYQPALYMSMLETAEIVAERYGISRERQDEFALQSQRRTALAQQAGRFDVEIEPITTLSRKSTGDAASTELIELTLGKDEGNRPDTSLEALAGLKPVLRDGQRLAAGTTVTAGNSSQLSDGAGALVLMEEKAAERAQLPPLGAYMGMAVAGCDAAEMGIGPIYAVPKLLRLHGLTMEDIGLWELNEAFASQTLYCRDTLGIPNELLNVNGGAIALGHPYGMTGARMVGHLLIEGRRRHARYGIATLCIAGGMGAAALFEIF